MRPLEGLLLLADLLAFGALSIPFLRDRLWIGHALLIALLLAAVQMLIEGPRWQMLPAYGMTGLLALAWWLTRRAPISSRKQTHPLAVSMGAVALAIAIALPMAFPVFRFPQPSGPYAIGTVTYHSVDGDRQEAFSADPNDHRELMVQVWYPAGANTSLRRAPYVEDSRALGASLARLHHLPEFVFGHLRYITSNAIASAPMARSEASYPVLIFLEGLTGWRQMNTVQVEHLVSNGYVVVAIDQPYAAASVSFPDGRRVAGLSLDQMNGLIEQSIHPGGRAPLLNGRPVQDGVIPYFAQDVRFTLDQLAALNRRDPNDILTGRLDLQRAGVFGLSLGAIVGSEACRMDQRLRACLMMDAPMPADVVRDGLRQPSMWITRDAETMRLERRRSGGWTEADITEHQTTMRAAFEKSARGYFIVVPGMFHVNFTDLPLWSPLFRPIGISGPIDGTRAHGIVNAYSLAFFDRHLKGRSTSLLDGPPMQDHEVRLESRQRQSQALKAHLALPAPRRGLTP